MSRFVFPVDALPTDVFAVLTRFLPGFDLVRLSHVSQRLLTELLAPDAAEWQQRAPSMAAAAGDPFQTAKERYCRARTVRFAGRTLHDDDATNDRGGAIAFWPQSSLVHLHPRSFSIDLWFALLPAVDTATPHVHFGGILLGAQSGSWGDNRWPHFHQQFILVDTQGNLYCSVLDRKSVVATRLQTQRWYHLALTFDSSQAETQVPTQRVYLDGTLVHETTGQLHREAYQLRHSQLGSGCISGSALGKPTAAFCGWYGFHGVLGGCRLWRGVLQADDVRRAAQSQPLVADSGPVVEWTMETQSDNLQGDASLVRSTRPTERVYVALPPTPRQRLQRGGTEQADRARSITQRRTNDTSSRKQR